MTPERTSPEPAVARSGLAQGLSATRPSAPAITLWAPLSTTTQPNFAAASRATAIRRAWTSATVIPSSRAARGCACRRGLLGGPGCLRDRRRQCRDQLTRAGDGDEPGAGAVGRAGGEGGCADEASRAAGDEHSAERAFVGILGPGGQG